VYIFLITSNTLVAIDQSLMSLAIAKVTVIEFSCKDKSKVLPRTGHKDPEGE
jgi:hypothetical protein